MYTVTEDAAVDRIYVEGELSPGQIDNISNMYGAQILEGDPPTKWTIIKGHISTHDVHRALAGV